METQSALQKYIRTVDAINNHIEDHQSIFDDHKKLVLAEMDARSDVEDAAAGEEAELIKEPLLVGNWRVVAIPQTQEVWDEQKVLEALRISKEGAIATGLLMVNKRPTRIVISELKEPK